MNRLAQQIERYREWATASDQNLRRAVTHITLAGLAVLIVILLVTLPLQDAAHHPERQPAPRPTATAELWSAESTDHNVPVVAQLDGLVRIHAPGTPVDGILLDNQAAANALWIVVYGGPFPYGR